MAPPVSSSNVTVAIRQTASTQWVTVDPYSWYRSMGAGKPIKSGVFTFAGHPWTLVFYPGGYYPNSPYVAVFLRLENNLVMEQLRVVADFTLVDGSATGGAEAYTRRAHHTFRQLGEISCGFAEYLRQHDLEASGCLRGDRLVLECAMRLVEEGEELRTPPAPPPSDLQRDLRRMLEDGAGADVTFVAGGQQFRAHRCVLAARSPVLRAQLFGPMRDGRQVIELPDDVEPEVFEAVLRFVYGDALPTSGHGEEADAAMARKLLAAADLYALDGLSRASQDMLCRSVTPCTAADTYALADRLNMARVKAAVIEFLAVVDADGIEAVKASAEFQQLAAEDPALAKEMMSRVTTARNENPVRSITRQEMLVASLGLIVLVVVVPSLGFYFTH